MKLMKIDQFAKAFSSTMAKTKFKLKRNSPEIALVTGLVGVIGATVMACRATMKASEVAETTEKRLNSISKAVDEAAEGKREYTEKAKQIDTVVTYGQMVAGYVKLYAPAVVVGTVSILSILYSHRILSQRNASLAAGYAMLAESYKNYRERVAEKIGKGEENDIYHGAKTIKAEITEMTEDGKTKTKKVDKKVVNDLGFSPYARFFDEANSNWEPNAEYNLNFLRMVESQMTNRLRANGHLFLNEVYDALGMERSEIGQNIGWVYDPDSDVSDNYVDFDIYNTNKQTKRDFVNGYENVIIIEPNCDGDIMSRVFGR